MSKVLEASCVAGVVTCEGKPVEATILSEGIGESSGALILQQALAIYLTSNATDIKESIEALNSMITKITTVLTALDGALSSANTATIAQIVAENLEFGLKKDMLK